MVPGRLFVIHNELPSPQSPQVLSSWPSPFKRRAGFTLGKFSILVSSREAWYL